MKWEGGSLQPCRDWLGEACAVGRQVWAGPGRAGQAAMLGLRQTFRCGSPFEVVRTQHGRQAEEAPPAQRRGARGPEWVLLPAEGRPL